MADMQKYLAHELYPREKVVWTGKPPSRAWLTSALNVASILLFLYVLYRVCIDIITPSSGLGSLLFQALQAIESAELTTSQIILGGCLLVFVCSVLIALSSGPGDMVSAILSPLSNGQRILYVITDHRALILFESPIGLMVQSFWPLQLKGFEIRAGKRDSGDILLKSRVGLPTLRGFRDVPDLQAARRALEQLIQCNPCPPVSPPAALSGKYVQQLQAKLAMHLQADEQLLWQGGSSWHRSDGGSKYLYGIMPLSIGIPATCIGIFSSQPGMVMFAVIGLVFVAVGLGLLMEPVMRWHKARKRIYAITSKRVLCLEGQPATVTEYRPARLNCIFRKSAARGRSHVIFSQTTTKSFEDTRLHDLQLTGVRDGRGAEAALHWLAAQAPAPTDAPDSAAEAQSTG